MKKLEERIDKRKKLFVLNICNQINTLHINDGRCHCVQYLVEWKDFETEQAALKYAKDNLRRCKRCFQL